LEGDRLNAQTLINDEETGLLTQISTAEADLAQNIEDQAKEKQLRKDEAEAYAVNVAEIEDAQVLIQKAIEVLGNYYSSVNEQARSLVIATGVGLAQVSSKQEPESLTLSTPASRSDGGKSVINMLEFIFNETRREAVTATSQEEQAQTDYADMITKLTEDQAASHKTLADLQASLAARQKDLETAKEELQVTAKGLEMLTHYVASIKGGCDFVIANKDLRDANRAQEKKSLEDAKTQIMASPAYNTAVQAETYGSCWRQCQDNEQDIHCVACRAGHSTEFLCHKWPGTPGCELTTTQPHQWMTTAAPTNATA